MSFLLLYFSILIKDTDSPPRVGRGAFQQDKFHWNVVVNNNHTAAGNVDDATEDTDKVSEESIAILGIQGKKVSRGKSNSSADDGLEEADESSDDSDTSSAILEKIKPIIDAIKNAVSKGTKITTEKFTEWGKVA